MSQQLTVTNTNYNNTISLNRYDEQISEKQGPGQKCYCDNSSEGLTVCSHLYVNSFIRSVFKLSIRPSHSCVHDVSRMP